MPNTSNTGSFVLNIREADKTTVAIVGGKGANLGELTRIDGIKVPAGFCVTTEAFKKVVWENPPVMELLDQLSNLESEARYKIGEVGSRLRSAVEDLIIPGDIREEITGCLNELGEHNAYAIRSSATAEDMPAASFAGQQDTYLNIMGKASILEHITKCWASLFTERAIIYRLQNGFEHRNVTLSVIVQQMVFPQASGILFTADPVTSNRKVVSIDAGFGLGEPLVSGRINADVYKVKNGAIVDKKISAKKLAALPLKNGGTHEQEIGPEQQEMQVLTDEKILRLERLGRTIERHFGCPQDIEWCLADDEFYIVQSRPITTLFPIPETDDKDVHVFISVGHQQMMTEPMKPLGLSLFQLTAFGRMFKGGGRLFVDVAERLATPTSRKMIIDTMGQHDPLLKDTLINLLERGDFIINKEDQPINANPGRAPISQPPPLEYDQAAVFDLVSKGRAAIEALKQGILGKSGPELFAFIMGNIAELKKRISVPENIGIIMAAANAASWINEKMLEWLGEKNAADVLSQSLPGNVTSEMGLALLDLADAIRPYPEVVAYLERSKDDDFLDGLMAFDGGPEVRDAIADYLVKYGMRCAGEIDITRSRWSEKPAVLIPMIFGNVKNFEAGAGRRKFDQGLQEVVEKEQDLLGRLKQLPDGELKAAETKQMIDRIRNLAGYREWPKYDIINHYFIYRQALLKEADKLLQAGISHEREDIYWLTFEEFREAVRLGRVDHTLVSRRKEEYRLYEKLTPPRVITSDGEIVTGKYNREDLPAGAIAGLPVSSGIIEGRARVISKIEDACLEEGDILVTTFADPSWTPLFVSIKGLVTEVGGLMTHGAVIAREYGLPAVVGVENATKLIKDGQRIRVNGTDGYVELL